MTAAMPPAAPGAGIGVDLVEVRRGVYHDSVTLLRMSQAVAAVEGVQAAQVAMATPFNLDFATAADFAVPATAGPNDLIVAVRGDDPAAIQAALAAFEALLTAADRAARAPGGFGAAPAPRSVRAAADAAPDASLVLISVPGPAVLGEAMDAVAAGRHVMIFSDNVPVEHEIVLKDAAADRGVLVMGPDCGTAMVGGIGLGFANVLDPQHPGPAIGVAAASGTGAQQLTSLLDDAGVAVSAVLGLGGRDLSAAVGGRSALTALALLDEDPGTDHIVLISKPADPATATRVLAAATAAATPFTSMVLGAAGGTITSGVEQLLRSIGVPVPQWKRWGQEPAEVVPTGQLRGLFAGGTLADEAMLVLTERLGGIVSNIPLRRELALPAQATPGLPQLAGLGAVVLDLGDDRFTSGRPHPMIDPTIRLQLLAQQGADPEVSVVLLDVVLGHGAEPDPAARLAPVIAAARSARSSGGPLHVVVSLCGTTGDPQDRERQATELVAAGATVYASNAQAAVAAAAFALPGSRS